MSGCQPNSSVKPSGWGEIRNNPSGLWRNRKTTRPRATSRKLILPKNHTTFLMEDRPTKILKIRKSSIV